MSRRTFAIFALASVCVGCTILAPEPDRAQFFVLTPVAQQTSRTDRSLTLGIGPVVVAYYLGRPQIVRRVGENRLVFSQDTVWGEPLDRSIRRVLAENLSRRLGTVDTVQYPWSAVARVDYQIPIEILRFEADEHGTVSLDARWMVRRPGQPVPLLSRESTLVETPRDSTTGSVVDAMSEAIGKLSDEVATAIRRLDADRPR